MSYGVDLATKIKESTKPPAEAAYYVGEVVSLSPLKISLLGGEVIAQGKCLRLTETVQRLLAPLPECVLAGCHHGLLCDHPCFPKPLQVGEKVAVIGKSVYLALDRVKEEG